jgi:DNA-binding response OmpR family regulator
MGIESILLVEDRLHVREAVARPYIEAGARVQALATCAEAIDFLALYRPDWILVGEEQANELLFWLRGHQDRVGVPVVLLPDLQLVA